MDKVHCIKCGIIEEYKTVPNPYSQDGNDFKYSKCKCGS